MVRTVAAIYTAKAIVEPISALFAEHLPDVRLINIMDDSLIQDVIRENGVPRHVVRRLLSYYRAAQEAGAEVILNTCSSVGEVVDLARKILDIPILKIDEPMARQAVTSAKAVGVLATLPTTLGPTVRLIQSEARRLERQVDVAKGLAEGAFDALLRGAADEHDRRVLRVAERLADKVDLFVLAQASMGRLQRRLEEISGKPVLSSPESGVMAVKAFLREHAS